MKVLRKFLASGLGLFTLVAVVLIGAIAPPIAPWNPSHSTDAPATQPMPPWLLGSNLTEESKVAQQAQLVDIQAISPRIRLDIRYATPHNFTHRTLYSQSRCILRIKVAERLAQVQQDLERQKLGLKVYDCYRPLSVQKLMWQLVPDPNYVANPAVGSRHNRGSAIDLTLVDGNGKELPMPSGFDEFTERAHLDYTGGSATARQYRQILQKTMNRHGFVSLQTEWWHFDDPDWQNYPVIDIPLEQVKLAR